MALIQKAFSDIITFSRSSNATRVGPTGVLEYAPHNFSLYSEQIDNAYWTKNSVAVTANSAAAPNGTITADLLTTNNSAATVYRVYSGAIAQYNTISAYVKYINHQYAYITSGTAFAVFDIIAGTVTTQTGAAASINSVGNGWYRISLTASALVLGDNLQVGLAPSSSNYVGSSLADGKQLLVWGAQAVLGPYALDYTPTTSAAVYGPRFDYDGSGVTIVEPVSTNLVLYSQEFDNAAWTKLASTVTANSTTAPDGTLTADTVTGDGTNASHVVRQSVTLLPNTTYVCSAYAKANTNNFGYLFCGGTGAGGYSTFDYSAGSLGANQGSLVSRSITNAGNGWYRAAIVFTTGGTVGSNFIEFTTSPIDTGSSVVTSGSTFYWGAQLEIGSTATAYMVSGASNGFRAVPVVSGSATPKGLLVEEQRQNLFTYSEQFDNAAWSKTGTTVIANSTGAPDGLVTADEITFGTGTSALVQTKSGLSAGARYEPSVYIKRITTSGEIILRNTEDGSYGRWAVNLALLGSGWERITRSHAAVTITAEFVASPSGICAPAFYGSDSNIKAHLWGAQLELGSFSTSYIPTLASAVTRTADVASVNTLSPWYSSSESTLFVEFDIIGAGSPQTIASLQASAAADGLLLYKASSGLNMQAYVDASSANLGAVSLNTAAKVALAYNGSANGAVLNGGSVSSVGTTVSAAATKLSIGASFNGTSNKLNGHLRRIAYYPRRLTNAELQALTA